MTGSADSADSEDPEPDPDGSGVGDDTTGDDTGEYGRPAPGSRRSMTMPRSPTMPRETRRRATRDGRVAICGGWGRRTVIALVVLVAAIGWIGSGPSAGVGAQATPTATIEPATAVADGQRVTVSWVGMQPGVEANIVISGEFPWGDVPERLNFEELGRSVAATGPDGSGSTTFLAHVAHGLANDGKDLTCGRDGQRCWVVVVQHPERQPLVAGAEIAFSPDAVSTATAPSTTAAPVSPTAPGGSGAVGVDAPSSDHTSALPWLVGAVTVLAAGVVALALAARRRRRPEPPEHRPNQQGADGKREPGPDPAPRATEPTGPSWPDDEPGTDLGPDTPLFVTLPSVAPLPHALPPTTPRPDVLPLDPSSAYEPLRRDGSDNDEPA